MKQQFLEDKEGTLRLTIYDHNRPLIPSSVKVTLYKPAGSILQDQATATIDADTGEMTYALTTTHTVDKGLNFKVVWEYVYNGVTYFETQLFDVVKSTLSIPITDDDLYNELENLRKANMQAVGTATAATSTTLVDTARRKEDDDYWKGGIVEILAGTGVGQKRDVSAFAQSTATATVTPAWTTTPDATSVYRFVKSFANKINASFEKLEGMLYNKGKRHELILESSQIKIALTYMTIHFIALDLMDETGDYWTRIADIYWKKFENEFSNMHLEYDEDESGAIGDEEKQTNVSEVRIGRC